VHLDSQWNRAEPPSVRTIVLKKIGVSPIENSSSARSATD
jgi:hypothetical protein